MSNLVKISGRTRFIAGIESIEKVSAGRFLIKNVQGFAFFAIGGVHSGGARNEWFVTQAMIDGHRDDNAFTGHINRNSLMACARCVAFI